MATIYITEYSDVGITAKGVTAQVGLNDGNNVKQQITFTATHGVSAAFGNSTQLVRISCDGAGFLEFGPSPVAVTGAGDPVQANTPEYFGVVPGQKVSAVS